MGRGGQAAGQQGCGAGRPLNPCCSAGEGGRSTAQKGQKPGSAQGAGTEEDGRELSGVGAGSPIRAPCEPLVPASLGRQVLVWTRWALLASSTLETPDPHHEARVRGTLGSSAAKGGAPSQPPAAVGRVETPAPSTSEAPRRSRGRCPTGTRVELCTETWTGERPFPRRSWPGLGDPIIYAGSRVRRVRDPVCMERGSLLSPTAAAL